LIDCRTSRGGERDNSVAPQAESSGMRVHAVILLAILSCVYAEVNTVNALPSLHNSVSF